MEELAGLGSHVGDLIASHDQTHAASIAAEKEKREGGKLERQAKATELRERVKAFLDRENKYNDKSPLNERIVAKREDGTVISGQLGFNGSQYNDQELRRITSERYVDQGLIRSQEYSGKKLTEADLGEDGKTGPLARRKSEFTGMTVRLLLSSQDEETGVRTHNSVEVGTVLDPESMLVPEPPLDGAKQYSVIGPDDPRFNAIAQTVATLTNPATPQHGQGIRVM